MAIVLSRLRSDLSLLLLWIASWFAGLIMTIIGAVCYTNPDISACPVKSTDGNATLITVGTVCLFIFVSLSTSFMLRNCTTACRCGDDIDSEGGWWCPNKCCPM